MSKGIIKNESTGVYVGVLLEDMMDTISREHRMYCDVHIPEFYFEDYSHPLTYVPLWAMSLPLKKGDTVLVKFNQDNLLFPELYKNPSEIDSGFYEQFDVSKWENESKKTISATNFGKDSYLIKTENYTVIHQNNGFLMIDDKDNVYVYGNSVSIKSMSKITVDCENAVVNSSGEMKITASKFSVNGHLEVTCET